MGHSLGNNYGKQYSFLNKPVWVDGNFKVAVADSGGLGITNLRGQGFQNVFMHTSATPGRGNNGYLNPNPASGYAWIQLNYNYNRYCGSFNSFISPLTGSNIRIDSGTAGLTAGTPYVITAVGAAAAGTVTIAPVADVSGSLASSWFKLFDAYGNTYIVWIQVSGTGSAPVGVSGTLVQVQIATNDTAATIGGKLVTVLGGLLAAQPGNLTAPSGVFSFTAAGTTTVTLTNTSSNPKQLPGAPQEGSVATGFTFAVGVNDNNLLDWQGVGLPKGITPAVNASFVAKATGFGSSTGTVKAAGKSTIDFVEIIGDPNQTIAPIPQGGSPNVGGWILVQFLASTSSSVTTLIPTAPADGSIVYFGFLMEASSIVISGD